MVSKTKNRFWRRLRIYFRRARISVWLLVLVALGCLVYVNQIGLPDFIKTPLLGKLRARGVDLEFSRLRLRFYRGLVAENVHFGRSDSTNSPRLNLRQVQLHVDARALKHFRFQFDALTLADGRFIWPVGISNAPGRELAVENIHTELRLLPNDEWALNNFTADFAGAHLRLSGDITNASAMREWSIFRHRKPGARPAGAVWQNRLIRLADVLERVQFSKPPDLLLEMRGDGRDPQSFMVRMELDTPGAETPWGMVRNGKLALRLFPRERTAPFHAEAQLEADGARTRWAAMTNLNVALRLFSADGSSDKVKAFLTASASTLHTGVATASNANITATSIHTFTNWIPLSGEASVGCDFATSRWGSAQSARLGLRLATPEPSQTAAADDSWGLWQKIQPWLLDWECQSGPVESPRLRIKSFSAAGGWRAPTLTVTNLAARLYDGGFEGSASLDVVSRILKATVHSGFDVREAEGILTPGGRHWLSQFSWGKSPDVQASGSVTLPAWTNRHPNWRAVQPLLVLGGVLKAPSGGAFNGVPVAYAESHFSYSNMLWRLPDLKVLRPEGDAAIALESSDRTKEFHFQVASSIDPTALKPLFPTNVQKAFRLISLTGPPLIEADIWGHWHHHERTGFKASVVATNFAVRHVPVDQLLARLEYTNKTLLVLSPAIKRGTEHLSADALRLVFDERKIYVTNGVGTADPQAITRAIGPHVERVMKPYHFDQPPTARVWGVIPMRDPKDADLYFDLAGGSFHWWKLRASRLSGRIHWAGDNLSLKDVSAGFYGGEANGSANFEFKEPYGVNYRFNLFATNALLRDVMTDLSGHGTSLQGRLSGAVSITRANTENPDLLAGYGSVQLRNGFIWSIPMFGVLSPALDSLIPGLGSSPATEGGGAFVITNGAIQSDNLEIRSPALRLQYHGAVSLEGKVNARVEAMLLRDVWLVGPLVSTVLWPVTKLFEYKVTGSLSQPKIDPLYFVPRIVLLPFHPLKSIKEMMPEENSGAPPPKQK